MTALDMAVAVFKTKNDKADTTTSAARAIIAAEIQQREAKTAKLKALRLEREAGSAAAEAARPAAVADRRRRKPKV
jgi:hypothetical protein